VNLILNKKLYKMKHLIIAAASALFLLSSIQVSSQTKVTAKRYATNAGEQLMKEISPRYGQSLDVYIVESEYDYNNKRYEMQLDFSWSGKTWFGGDRRIFNLKGFLTVNDDGTAPKFEITSVNQAIRDANSAKIWATIGSAGAAIVSLMALSDQ
jgi:hypothetical protein